MKKTIFPVVATAAVTSLLTFWGISKFTDNKLIVGNETKVPIHYASNNAAIGTQPIDFSPAAESSVKSVVHVKTMTQGKTVVAQDPFGFWGPQRYRTPDQMGAGSGVIISQDGYIITNNHVVQGADQVQVTFNDRNTQIAKVVGTDPSTDIAVLKIDDKQELNAINIGNSDQVKLGQWVLAVGYPLNLDATVTAGIVSAKSRSLGINDSRNKTGNGSVESYIQTDAAVNPGNSGGALVNANGQLVGINAAIASPTGSYAGYSYAIPSNLALKVASDIIKFGTVQRGYLGARLADLNKMTEQSAEQLGISSGDFRNAKGVFVMDIVSKSGASEAGLKKGDFITMINGIAVNSVPELTEQVARYHPGDKVSVGYIRNGKPYNATVELKNMAGKADINTQAASIGFSGATMRSLNAEELKKYNVVGGVVVTDVKPGSWAQKSNIQKGFVIISANDEEVMNVNDFQAVASQSGKGVQIGGFYPGKRGMYYYGLTGDLDTGY